MGDVVPVCLVGGRKNWHRVGLVIGSGIGMAMGMGTGVGVRGCCHITLPRKVPRIFGTMPSLHKIQGLFMSDVLPVCLLGAQNFWH